MKRNRSFFNNGMILYVENSIESMHKLLELISLVKLLGRTLINKIQLLFFLNINSKQLENVIFARVCEVLLGDTPP